jgi:VPDSG-CTERM motif
MKFNQKTKGLKAIAVMAIAVVGSFLTAGSAKAVSFTGDGGLGAGFSATADFTTSLAGNLILTLTNTGTADVNDPSKVLTAVFFDIAGNPTRTLSSVSAVLGAGSTVVYDPDGQPAGGVVGGEWAYANFLASTNPFNATQGVSSAGLGLFGAATFPGADLAGPPNGAVNGVQYGILPTGWTSAGDNAGLTGSGGLIKNSVVFDLGAFTLADLGLISNVGFQYGTAFGENQVPDGGGTTLMLLGSALACLGVLRRRFC